MDVHLIQNALSEAAGGNFRALFDLLPGEKLEGRQHRRTAVVNLSRFRKI
jgi:hypothetical protein